jgi:hypothetical protein
MLSALAATLGQSPGDAGRDGDREAGKPGTDVAGRSHGFSRDILRVGRAR